MSGPLVQQAVVYEDGSATFMARLLGGVATAIVQADVASIDASVFKLDIDGNIDETILGTGDFSIVIGEVIFNTLQTGDPRWDESPDLGFNFLHEMSPTAFPTGGATYRVEYRFTMADGKVIWALYEPDAVKVLMS